jgi:deoxycytidylate deaminase
MIRLAKKESVKSTCRCRHGATVVRGGSVLGKGYNKYKTHATLGGGPLKTLHAEAAAIRDAVRRGIDLRGATIYVARTGKGSNMSRPCGDCQAMIEAHGIRKVVYTDEDGNVLTEYPLDVV